MHISLPFRKITSARTIALKILGQGMRFTKNGAVVSTSRAWQEVLSKTDAVKINPTASLSEQLRGFANSLSTWVSNEPQLEPNAKKLVEKMVLALGSVDCEACAREFGGRVCDERHDGGEQAAQAVCTVQLRELFEIALEAGEAWYKRYSDDFDPIRLPKPLFSTDRGKKDPVDGVTTINNLQSAICLKIDEEQFQEAAIYSILYVLFHECFVHVFQSLDRSVRQREVAPNECLFSEGFMDGVAYMILERELRLLGHCKERLTAWGQSVPFTFMRRFCQTLFDARVLRNDPRPIIDARETGREIASLLYSAFATLEGVTDPLVELARLALTLNYKFSPEQNLSYGFLNSVHRAAIGTVRDDPDSLQRKVLIDALAAYVKSHDLQELVKVMEAI